MGLPRRVAGDLRAHGWHVDHVAELGMATAPDDQILRCARDSGQIVVTLDSDFSMLLALRGHSRPSVIHLRLARMDRARVVSILRGIISRVGDSLQEGCIVSVVPTGMRIRRLPIIAPRGK